MKAAALPAAFLFLFQYQAVSLAQPAGPAGEGRGFGRMGRDMNQSDDITVTVVAPENGTVTVTPAIPDDGVVAEGTVITVTATPDDGYTLDSCYYVNAGGGGFGITNIEFITPQIQIMVDRSIMVGASFIEKEALKGLMVTHNVEYARPGVKKLKYDVFSPNGADNLPCIIIIHGGGWSMNTEDVMRGLARELARGGDYVVFSIDYRWIGTLDGDETPNTMADIIEDVFGAICHIQEHAGQYGADPSRIAVTGDSAGGHLSAAAINMIEMIGDGGFGENEGIFQYRPTYMPRGKSLAQVREDLKKAIKAAAPSYGVFDAQSAANFMGGQATDAEIRALSPIYHIPDAEKRRVPQLLLRGTNDMLITDDIVSSYADALKAAGQRAEYVLVEGAGHAFFDWKPDASTQATFKQYGVPYAAVMKKFFDEVFYPDK